jgi:hypothetical protein
LYKATVARLVTPALAARFEQQAQWNTDVMRRLDEPRGDYASDVARLTARVAELEAELAAIERRLQEIGERRLADLRDLEKQLAEFNHGRFVDTRNLEHFAHGELLQLKKELAALAAADVHSLNLAGVRHREIAHTVHALETTVESIRKRT